mgnify:FL=1
MKCMIENTMFTPVSKERWDTLINKTLHYHEYLQELGSDVQDNEIALIISVLKNNTPFNVVEKSDD